MSLRAVVGVSAERRSNSFFSARSHSGCLDVDGAMFVAAMGECVVVTQRTVEAR